MPPVTPITELDIEALVDSQLDWEQEKRVRHEMTTNPSLMLYYSQLISQKKLLASWWQQEQEKKKACEEEEDFLPEMASVMHH